MTVFNIWGVELAIPANKEVAFRGTPETRHWNRDVRNRVTYVALLEHHNCRTDDISFTNRQYVVPTLKIPCIACRGHHPITLLHYLGTMCVTTIVRKSVILMFYSEDSNSEMQVPHVYLIVSLLFNCEILKYVSLPVCHHYCRLRRSHEYVHCLSEDTLLVEVLELKTTTWRYKYYNTNIVSRELIFSFSEMIKPYFNSAFWSDIMSLHKKIMYLNMAYVNMVFLMTPTHSYLNILWISLTVCKGTLT